MKEAVLAIAFVNIFLPFLSYFQSHPRCDVFPVKAPDEIMVFYSVCHYFTIFKVTIIIIYPFNVKCILRLDNQSILRNQSQPLYVVLSGRNVRGRLLFIRDVCDSTRLSLENVLPKEMRFRYDFD